MFISACVYNHLKLNKQRDKDMSDKMTKINVIVNHLKAKNQAENKELCKQNLHSQQVAFDAGDATLALMFRTDAEINKAFDMLVR